MYLYIWMWACVCVCIDRTAGKRLSPRGNSQPCFTSGRAKLSNYRSQLCQKPPLFLSIDGMTGLHPLTHTHTHIQTRTHFSLPLFSWCTCLPALQASSTPIKGAELFSSRKLIQHLSPGFILGIEDCERECKSTVCVCESRIQSVWERDSLCFWKIKRKKKVCAWLFCVRIWERTYGDYKADCILFSGNGVSKDSRGIVRVLFCRGQISSNTKIKRAFILL